MATTRSSGRWVRLSGGWAVMGMVLRALIVGVLYLATARYGIWLDGLSGAGPAFWPSAGVTLTALVVSPPRMWPALLAAVGLAEFTSDAISGYPLGPTMTWVVAGVIEPLVAAWLIRRWGVGALEDVREVAAMVLAIVVGATVGGTVGAIGMAGEFGTGLWLDEVGRWMIGDGLGMLTVLPFGLVVCRRLARDDLRTAEGALALAAVAGMAIATFRLEPTNAWATAEYLVLLPMLWVALRLRLAAAAVAVFLVAQIAFVFHALGRGSFVLPELDGSVGAAQIQLFLATVTLTVLVLASRSVERDRFQRLADAREQLIAAVSHELRTPLTPIVGFSELLLRQGEQLTPASRQAAEVIHRNGHHLTSLVDDLLQVSRTRQTPVTAEPRCVRLDTHLAELVVEREQDGFDLRVPPGLAAWVDRTHLTQIVTNLLDNAARYGRPPVAVSASHVGDRVEIAVVDHGDGVPDWFVDELFDEFAQATKGDRRATLGLGLGLSIARSLAEANDGVLAHRTVDQGACFVLTLPAAKVGREDAPSSSRVVGG